MDGALSPWRERRQHERSGRVSPKKYIGQISAWCGECGGIGFGGNEWQQKEDRGLPCCSQLTLDRPPECRNKVGQQLDIDKFLVLRKQESGTDDSNLIVKLEVCTQSIHRWLQYCEYHYVNLVNAAAEPNLKLDMNSSYRRAGETVTVRYVYEANIAAFLNSLHALLDSFPYLLNLFIPVSNDPESTSIKWQESFIKKYESMAFYDELMSFLMDETFHKVKGYANTIKHKHLIRILNQWNHLEFEEYIYKKPYRDEQGKVRFMPEIVVGENVITYIEECHDELIPKFFNLCDSVLHFKGSQLA